MTKDERPPARRPAGSRGPRKKKESAPTYKRQRGLNAGLPSPDLLDRIDEDALRSIRHHARRVSREEDGEE